MPPYRIDNTTAINVDAGTLYTATRDGAYRPVGDFSGVSVGDLIWETAPIVQSTTHNYRCGAFEIINCKNCKYYNQDGYEWTLGWCNLDNRERTSDWYCAGAEGK